MAVLSRDFEGGGFGRTGIIWAVVGLAVVLSLFFIPEIIEFQKSLTSDAPTKSAQKKGAEAAMSSGESVQEDALNTIQADETSGVIDRLSSLLDSKSSASDARASLSDAPRRPSPERNADAQVEISWDRLKSRESKEALMHAKATAAKISKRVGDQGVRSRYALLNFSNGIDFVLERGAKSMGPLEAVHYIDSLSQAVGRALSQDPVDRTLALQWSKVSLGPLVGAGSGNSDVHIRPFNPQMTLTWLKLRQRSKNGVPNPEAAPRAYIGGYLLGSDVDSLELLTANGGVRRKVSISGVSRKDDYRFFRLTMEVNSPMVLRVRDKTGMVYEKTYDFRSARYRFPYERESRSYQLPFSMSFATRRRFVENDIDLRLDANFALSIWRGTEAQLAARSTTGVELTSLQSSAEGQLFSSF